MWRGRGGRWSARRGRGRCSSALCRGGGWRRRRGAGVCRLRRGIRGRLLSEGGRRVLGIGVQVGVSGIGAPLVVLGEAGCVVSEAIGKEQGGTKRTSGGSWGSCPSSCSISPSVRSFERRNSTFFSRGESRTVSSSRKRLATSRRDSESEGCDALVSVLVSETCDAPAAVSVSGACDAPASMATLAASCSGSSGLFSSLPDIVYVMSRSSSRGGVLRRGGSARRGRGPRCRELWRMCLGIGGWEPSWAPGGGSHNPCTPTPPHPVLVSPRTHAT